MKQSKRVENNVIQQKYFKQNRTKKGRSDTETQNQIKKNLRH